MFEPLGTRKFSYPSKIASTTASITGSSGSRMFDSSASRKFSCPAPAAERKPYEPGSFTAKQQSNLDFAATTLIPSSGSRQGVDPVPTRKMSLTSTTRPTQLVGGGGRESSGSYLSRKYALGSSNFSKSLENNPRTPSTDDDSFSGMPDLETMSSRAPTVSKPMEDDSPILSRYSSQIDTTSSHNRVPQDESASTMLSAYDPLGSSGAYDTGIDEDEKIPCEFCEEPIPIMKLIKHQVKLRFVFL